MSMIGNYRMLEKETVEKMKSGELSVADYIYDEDEENEQDCLDIDKTWHAIHFTLNGEAYGGNQDDPISKLVFNGNLISEEDLGYGPGMLLEADDVKKAAERIKEISQEEFRSGFNIQKMRENDIYPVMADENEEQFFCYVWENFDELKKFFQRAAQQEKDILFYIN